MGKVRKRVKATFLIKNALFWQELNNYPTNINIFAHEVFKNQRLPSEGVGKNSNQFNDFRPKRYRNSITSHKKKKSELIIKTFDFRQNLFGKIYDFNQDIIKKYPQYMVNEVVLRAHDDQKNIKFLSGDLKKRKKMLNNSRFFVRW